MAAVRIFQLHNARRRQPRMFRDRTGLSDLRDFEVLNRYRLDRPAIFSLTDLLEEDLLRVTNRSCAIDPLTQVLTSLRFLGKGDFFSEIGDLHGISRSSVSVVFAAFLDALNLKLDNIRFPRGRDIELVKLQFYRACAIPNVVGAVDCTHIPIIAPVADQEVYVCQKGFHSINVQAVVDSSMRYTDVVAKWPGSQHDSAIFDDCGLKEYLETTGEGVLLGDSGYPLRTYLLTPLLSPGSPQEVRYNENHSKGRVVVERSFGVLKSRFRCLQKSGGCLPFKPTKCSKTIMACMRLHNLCTEKRIPLQEPVVPLDEDQGDVLLQPTRGNGVLTRNSVIRLF